MQLVNTNNMQAMVTNTYELEGKTAEDTSTTRVALKVKDLQGPSQSASSLEPWEEGGKGGR